MKGLLKKIKPLIDKENDGENSLYSVLEHVCDLNEENVPKCYVDLIHEVTKNTPIVGLIQSQSRVFLVGLKSYLDKNVDIFSEKDILDHVNGEVPVLMGLITSLKAYEGTVFLPDKVIDLFNAILSLNLNVRKLAAERFVKSKDFLSVEPKNEIYPSLPLHSSKKIMQLIFQKLKTMKKFATKTTRKHRE